MDEPEEVVLLLVDDQPIVAEAIRRALSAEPQIHFHYCRDGELALETARRIKPTIILQDLLMPGIEGLALVRQYRSTDETRNVPIVVLSTREESAVKSESFASGANDYLVKLPDDLELVARIRYHSRAFVHQLQRDQAYEALRQSRQILIEQNLQLERFSHIDGVTGLANRRHFDEFATMQWNQAIRERTAYAVLMVDVDNFKSYNDTYGHLAGDRCLISVAAALKSACLRPTDLVARFGGEEFIVSLETGLSGAGVVAENLRLAVASTNNAHGATIVTVSVGGAVTFPTRDDSLVELIRTADAALYEAKHSGRNRCVIRSHAATLTA